MHPSAKELHEVYTPAWKAVPGTRPNMLGIMGGPGGATGFLQGEIVGGVASFLNRLPDANAAALCRCAVEDWLRNGGFTVQTFNRENKVTAKMYNPHSGESGEGTGSTIHHALAAAALAVAGGRG